MKQIIISVFFTILTLSAVAQKIINTNATVNGTLRLGFG